MHILRAFLLQRALLSTTSCSRHASKHMFYICENIYVEGTYTYMCENSVLYFVIIMISSLFLTLHICPSIDLFAAYPNLGHGVLELM